MQEESIFIPISQEKIQKDIESSNKKKVSGYLNREPGDWDGASRVGDQQVGGPHSLHVAHVNMRTMPQ